MEIDRCAAFYGCMLVECENEKTKEIWKVKRLMFHQCWIGIGLFALLLLQCASNANSTLYRVLHGFALADVMGIKKREHNKFRDSFLRTTAYLQSKDNLGRWFFFPRC